MSTAEMTIEVATQPPGAAGEARNDGLAGQLVTLKSTGVGSTHLIRLLTTTEAAVPTLTQTLPTEWTFTPPSAGEAYLLELVVDEGLATEIRTRRTFRIPTENFGLLVPAPNEAADPAGSLINNGSAVVEASNDNAGGNWEGWEPRMTAWLKKVDTFARGFDIPDSTSNSWSVRDSGTTYIRIDTDTQTITLAGEVHQNNVTNVVAADPLILLAGNQAGAPMWDSGFVVERGTSQNVAFLWDESAEEFAVVNTDETGGTAGNVAFDETTPYAGMRVQALHVAPTAAKSISLVYDGATDSVFLRDGGAVASLNNATVVGFNSVIGANAHSTTLVGSNNSVNDWNDFCVVVGTNNTFVDSSVTAGVIVGRGNSVGASDAVVVGSNFTTTNEDIIAIHVGDAGSASSQRTYAIVSNAAVITHGDVFAVGDAVVSTAAKQIIFGGNTQFHDMYLGQGVAGKTNNLAANAEMRIHASGGSSNAVNGTHLVLAGGVTTAGGAGVGASVYIRTAAVDTLVDRLEIRNDGEWLIGATPTGGTSGQVFTSQGPDVPPEWTTISTGESNTGANVGGGTGQVFRDKTGVTLNFKTLIGGTDISVVNGTDTITINSTAGGGLPHNITGGLTDVITDGADSVLAYSGTTNQLFVQNATTNGAVTFQGSGQIIMTGNLDANGGVDVTGGQLLVNGQNFTHSSGANHNVTGIQTISFISTVTTTFTAAVNNVNAWRVVSGAQTVIQYNTQPVNDILHLGAHSTAGTFVNDVDIRSRQLLLRGTSGAVGQVITSDASGVASWATPSTPTVSMQDTYDNGPNITANVTQIKVQTGSSNGLGFEVIQGINNSGPLVDFNTAATFTDTNQPTMLEINLSAATITSETDSYGINLVGVAQSGSGRSIGQRVTSAWEIGLQLDSPWEMAVQSSIPKQPETGYAGIWFSSDAGHPQAINAAGAAYPLQVHPSWQIGRALPNPSSTTAMRGDGMLASIVHSDTSSALPNPTDGNGVFFEQTTAASAGTDALTRGSSNIPQAYQCRPYMIQKFKFTGVVTSVRMFAGFTDSSPGPIGADAPTDNYVGVQFSTARPDTNFQFVRNDGGTPPAAVDSGIAPVQGTVYYVVVDYQSATSCTVSLLSNLFVVLASTTFTTDLPPVTNAPNFLLGVRALSASARAFGIYEVRQYIRGKEE
jgi:hypothetical protein